MTVAERLGWQQVVALETHQLELPGVSLQITPARHYLYGELAAHLLGYVGEVTKADLQEHADYHMGDEIGKFGLERVWESFLRGDAGGEEIEVDAVGRRLRVLKEIADKPGESIVMTIDLNLQQAAEQAMEGKNGAFVALDPRNGDVLAMVSHPAFDPDIFGGGVKASAWKELMTDPTHPLQNRVIQGIYPPGSTFKIVDSIAGLQEGTLHPTPTYNCPGGMWFGGREYHCWRKQGHGTIELHRRDRRSCDVYFYNVGEQLGVDRIAKWANLMGLGVKTGIDLDHENPGTIPSSAWKQKRYHERWYPAETLSVAIGQGYVATTPLQMAEVAAAGRQRRHPLQAAIRKIRRGPRRQYRQDLSTDRREPDEDRSRRARRRARTRWPTSSTAWAAPRTRRISTTSSSAARLARRRSSATKGLRAKTRPKTRRPSSSRITRGSSRSRPRIIRTIAAACIIEHGGHGGSASAPVIHDVFQRYFQLYPPTARTGHRTRAGRRRQLAMTGVRA